MTERRSGILLVTRNFPPLRGGMERLNERMLAGLAEQESVCLVGPRGCIPHAPAAAMVAEVPPAPVWRFLWEGLSAGIRMARRCRPRLVLAGSGLAAPLAWLAARLSGARCAVYLHGLDLVVPHPVYQAIWLPFIRRCDLAIANSRNTADLAIARGVDAGRLQVVNPGTDVPGDVRGSGDAFRSAQGFEDRPLLLSVGRLTARKGLVEFVRDVLPEIVRTHPRALLVVIGADAGDALAEGAHPGSRQQRIAQQAASSGVGHALVFLPHCDDEMLSAAYAAADVHVFPVLDLPGDVEGFGMVAIEAAAHGLPTVAYAVGGVPDAIADGISGALVAPADPAGFARAVGEWLRGSDARRAACRMHAARFTWPHFHAGVRAALADAGS